MTPPDIRDIADDAADAFIAKWSGVAASELSTSQSFLIDLCRMLGVEAPHPTPEQNYMFERPITFAHGDGSTSAGRIDLYRRGAFVLESKKLKAAVHTKGFDEALLRARSQAEQYARALPADEGRPPFVVVVDVGNRIELYAEFSRSGATYTPFPDPRSHRIALSDLRNAELRERLRKIWTDPLALDPSRETARVTREIATQLAELAKRLEAAGHSAERVAQFLMRCLFTMFAEDVKLLPDASFRELLIRYAEQPDTAMRMLAQLWRDMDSGGFSAVIAGDVLRFNGKLFKQPNTLPLDKPQLSLLIGAAKADWKHVEPAIFGTLLERALSPKDRHKLGAHYTPRAYVERLVLPTVIEPLRAEWSDAQAAALLLAAEGKPDEAAIELRRFHHRLCSVRVLDPACGSGNFLYVTLEHLKRLEGEVLNALDELGDRQTGLALGSERADAAAGETVDPHNLLGIELNPRAAAIAEVVLWIGYLQWHFRTRGDVNPPIPVIRDFRNIENRDAVLAYDDVELVRDERGIPITRWDGETMKVSPITGEEIPDDSARKPVMRYINPRKAAWPEADFVVGNPPFIGASTMRSALGDGYVDALRGVWPEVPESSDFVMYWWHLSALLTRRGAFERFGLITTNSIRQTFNRRVIEAALLPSPVGRGAGGEGTAKRETASAGAPSSGAARHLLPVGEGERQALPSANASALLPSPAGRGAGGEGTAKRETASVDVPSSGAARHLLPLGEGERQALPSANASALLPSPAGRGAGGEGTAKRETSSADVPSSGAARHLLPVGEVKEQPLSLVFAIPDHPWVDAVDGAAVRIAMTVAARSNAPGRLLQVTAERDNGDEVDVDLSQRAGLIHADLRTGPDIASAGRLNANKGISNRGFCLFGAGFIIGADKACSFQEMYGVGADIVIKKYLNGRDLTYRPRGVYVIDLFGLSADESRNRYPAIYQHVFDYVKPERDTNKREVRKKNWWVFGEPNQKLRAQIKDLKRYISTVETAKHRVFQFLDSVISPDNMLIVIAIEDGLALGILSSELHVVWALAAGGRLGVGNDPRYNKSRCFDPFPFPASVSFFPKVEGVRDASAGIEPMANESRIRTLAENLDTHRKRQQAAHPDLTLTGMYNVLEKLRSGEPLSAKERIIHEHGLVSVLRQIHDDLDAAVLDAYGWSDLLPLLRIAQGNDAAGEGQTRDDAKRAFDDAVLERLVALNAERAAEEARGVVRWLRPEFQNPQAAPTQQTIDTGSDAETAEDAVPTAIVKPQPWPKDAVAQVRAVADVLSASPIPLSVDDIAARFTGRGTWKKRLPQLLGMLAAMGRAREEAGHYRAVG